MYLRYFVTLDESPQGLLGLSFMPSLVRVAPVRLVDPDRMGLPDLPGRWGRYHRALQTPMTGTMINVVCTPPRRWTWMHRLEAAIENNPDDPSGETETIEGRLELYTRGVRNVLITDLSADAFVALPEDQRATAVKYEAIVRPASAVHTVTDFAAFRRAILGA